MPFSMPCPHVDCKKMQSPYIEQKTDKVFCSLCEKEIPNVSHFAKIQMKTLKQYKEKKQVSFAVKCQSCSKEARPLIENNDVVCSFCKKPHSHLSEAFKFMLKEKLKNVDKDI